MRGTHCLCQEYTESVKSCPSVCLVRCKVLYLEDRKIFSIYGKKRFAVRDEQVARKKKDGLYLIYIIIWMGYLFLLTASFDMEEKPWVFGRCCQKKRRGSIFFKLQSSSECILLELSIVCQWLILYPTVALHFLQICEDAIWLIDRQ